jgi:hypothetical protein
MLEFYVGGIERDLLTAWAVHLGPALLVAAYTYYDASRRESRHPLAWAGAAVLLGGGEALVVGVLYYVVRDKVGVGDAEG